MPAEPWLGLIQLGRQLKVRTDATRDEVTGVIEQTNRAAGFTPQSVQTAENSIRQVFGVKVRLPSDTGKLRAGMSVDVSVPDMPPMPK